MWAPASCKADAGAPVATKRLRNNPMRFRHSWERSNLLMTCGKSPIRDAPHPCVLIVLCLGTACVMCVVCQYFCCVLLLLLLLLSLSSPFPVAMSLGCARRRVFRPHPCTGSRCVCFVVVLRSPIVAMVGCKRGFTVYGRIWSTCGSSWRTRTPRMPV